MWFSLHRIGLRKTLNSLKFKEICEIQDAAGRLGITVNYSHSMVAGGLVLTS